MMIRLAALALLLLSSGCSMLGAGRGGDPALADARARWEARGPADYAMTQSRNCFCPPDVRGPFEVTVRDGAVATVRLDGAPVPSERALSIDALFDLIADAYAGEAAEVRVSYDPALGYPTEIWIDYERQLADEETGYTVTALAPAR